MKALVYAGPRQIAVKQIEHPDVPSGYALVRVVRSGICGSDVHGYIGNTGRRDVGVVMGHEFSGVVETVAPDADASLVGKRVTVQPAIYCGQCDFCNAGRTQHCPNKHFLGVFSTHGGFAEYVSVPAHLVFELPKAMTFEQGAMIEPLAVAKCGVDKIADVRGKSALVVGAGTIGLLAISALKARGAGRIIAADLSDNRLAAAKQMGAEDVINPAVTDARAAVREITGETGADIAIEAVGATKPVETAIECLKPGGSCAWIGNSEKTISLDMQSVVTREITIYGTYIYSQSEFGETISTFAGMNIDLSPIISQMLTIEEAPEVIEQLASGSDTLIKTMIAF